MSENKHISIMPKEILELVLKLKVESIVDVTYGGGGHSKLFLENNLKLTAMDRDPSVCEKNPNVICDKFSNIDKYVNEVDIIFADLGISTNQLLSERGFSFMSDTLLDMRVDQQGDYLYAKIRKMSEYEMANIIKEYGEERNAKKIAKNIVFYRLRNDIKTTGDLVKAIDSDDYRVLSRVFQAFRIYINNEFGELESLLKKGKKISKIGMLILTFHSLEDRIVKRFFKENYKNNGFIPVSEEEIKINNSSRSAKLRFGFNI